MTDKVAHYQDLLKEAVRKVRDLKGQLESAQRTQDEPVAILGMGCRFPSAADTPAQFWQLLQAGTDTIEEMPAHRRPAQTDERETHQGVPLYRGGFLHQVDQFDACFFGIAPTEAHCLDPQQRLLLETSWEALEYAAIAPGGLANSATGVFCGISGSEYDAVLRSSEQADSLYRSTGTDRSTAAGRIAYTLGLTGPAIALDTACSSSLVAVYLACQSLRDRTCDLALAGGVGIILSADTTRMFADAGMLSPDSTCKTFDAAANGFVRGEGCGVLVLKRLSDALAAGDPVLAVIRGAAVNQDGRSAGLTAPNVLSQQAVIRQALQQARLTPDQISYIETHGTGTALGDPIETEAIGTVFASSAEPIWLGSVKTNLGHLEAAAGIAGLIKAVLCLQHRIIPPNLHFHTPNPHIDWENLPVRLPTTPVAWETTAACPSRIAGVSSFGYSGTNCHVILEQAPARPEADQSPADQPSCAILPLSAKQPAALAALIARYHTWLADSTAQKDLTLDDLCYTVQVGRDHFAYRASFVGQTREEVLTQLAAWDSATAGQVQQRPKVAFLCTGQGSQYAGMGQQLYQTQLVYRAALDECDALLRPELGGPSIREIISDTASEQIHQTACTQPALFVLEYALATLWQAWGVKPAILIGHSVGELAAACIAGVFSLADGLRLIAARARLMGALPAGGQMVSCLADEATIRQAIAEDTETVSIAAVNGPRSVVIAGAATALNRIVAQLKAAGIRTQQLQVSHAFHSPLMAPMLADFRQVAESITYHPPQIPLISNVTGQLADEAISTPDYWVRHVREAVRFADGIQTVYAQGATCLLEIGPKPILLGLARQADGPEDISYLPGLRAGRDDWQMLLNSLGQLYTRGVAIDWATFNQPYQRQKVALPTYPFQRERFWVSTHQQTYRPPIPFSVGTDSVQQPPDFSLLPRYLPEFTVLNQALVAFSDERLQAPEVQRQVQAAQVLKPLCVDYILAALTELGVSLQAGTEWHPDELMQQAGVIPAYHRLWHRLFGLLNEAGVLQGTEGRWRLRQMPVLSSSQSVSSNLAMRDKDLMEAELNLLKACAEHLAAVLRGTQDPLALLFPQGDNSLVNQVYQGSAIADVMNQIVQAALRQVLVNLPPEQGVRILEIGAGTGGTTASVLPLLPRAQTKYLFTDIGAGFFATAREKFSDYPFVHYQKLDIEQPPAEQGFKPAHYDIVIAVNVLHATRDLPITLHHVRHLLKPGGLLLLSEATHAAGWADLTFGLTAGWWRFADDRTYPLISVKAWKQRLSAAGFSAAAHTVTDDETGQNILLAQQTDEMTAQADQSVRFTDIRQLPVAERYNYIKDQVKCYIQTITGLTPDDEQYFPDLGLDSLMAVELRGKLEKATDLELPASLIFDYPTLHQLTDYLLKHLSEKSAALPRAECAEGSEVLRQQLQHVIATGYPELHLGDWCIRPAVLADVARLSELEQAAYGWIGEEAVASPELIAERIDRLNSGDHAWFWVMEKSEQVVAWQVLQPTQVEPYAYRSWAEATDDGTLASTFDPQGRYLYLVAAGSAQQLPTVASHLLTLQTLVLLRETGHDCLFYCSAMPGYAQHYAETGQSPEDYIAITDQAGIPKDEFIALSVYGWPVQPSFRVLRDGYPPDRDSCGHGVSVVLPFTDPDAAMHTVCQQIIYHARSLDLATDMNAQDLS